MSSSTGYIEVNGGTFETVPCKEGHNAIFYALYAAGEYGGVQCVINGGTFKTVGEQAAVLLGNDNPNGDGGINADAIANVYGGEFIAPEGVPALKVAQHTAKASILHGGSYSLLTEETAKYIDPAVVGGAGTNVVLTPRTAEGSVAKVGEGENAKYYASLQDAVRSCPTDKTETTIEMLQDYVVPDVVTVDGGRNIVLKLNGYTVSHNGYRLFQVSNAWFHITGEGTLLENMADGYAPIDARGAATDKGENYTVVTVDKDVVLKGDCYGIFTSVDEGGDKSYNNYGLVVNMYGTIDLNLEGGKENYGAGIYINGQNKNTEGNVPVYNLDGARMPAGGGAGIYAAGYAEWNLKDVTITALDALSLKAGTFVIESGSYTSTGDYSNPSTDTSNGSVDTGAALSMTSNDGYAKKLDVKVNGGIFESKKGNAVYEGIPNKTGTEVPVAGESYVALKINNGEFKSAEGKDAVDLTTIKDKSVISGGVFSTDVTKYCTEGLMAVKDSSGNYVIGNVQPLPDEVTVETHRTTGDTVTSVGGSIAEENIEQATEIASSVTPENLAEAVAAEVQDSEKADAVNKLKANGLIDVGEDGTITLPGGEDPVDVTVVYDMYLDVTITDLQNGGADTENSITLNIEPKYNLLATTGDPTLGAGETGAMTPENTVTLAKGKELTVEEGVPVEISIALPTGFADEGTTLFVKHTKDDDRTYVYSAVVDSNTLTFSNPHGFSTFIVTATDDTVAKIDDVCYTSLQDAVNAAQNNETVEVIKNTDLTAEMNSVSKTITIKNNTETEINVIVNDTEYTIASGDSQKVSYIKPIIDDGGSDYSPSYGITVDKAENGTAYADTQSASMGTAITVTVKPNKGYELNTLTVTDKDGNTVPVTNKDGKYIFIMPDSKVTIKAVFKEIKTATSNPFTDVDENAWYYDDIMYVYNKGLMTGTSDDTFSPYVTTTRGTIATILYRLEGEPKVSGVSSFDDVADSKWYADAVKWAADNKIVDGYGDGRFGPDDVITREQIAVIMYRYAAFKGMDMTKTADLSKFIDSDKVSVWSKDALSWANDKGIINGKGGGILDPKGNTSRAEIAAILHSFCENAAK